MVANQINTALNHNALTATNTSDVGMLGALNQLSASQGIKDVSFGHQDVFIAPTSNQNQLINKTTNIQQNTMHPTALDPLRDLVLNPPLNQEYLKVLAYQAANLPEGEDIIPCQTKTASSVKNLAGIFAGTENFVKKVEKKVKKKYTALECSDSEGFGEVLLGKISRIKRAKSAHLRNSASKKALEKRKLVLSSDSSSTEAAPIVEPVKETEQNLEYAEERMRSVKEQLKSDPTHFRPTNIDAAAGEEDQTLSATTSELTIKVEGSGEGQLVQSANIKHKKERKKKRSKTARNNRVAPTSKDPRPYTSGNFKPELEEPCSSPDPLEPWSTKNITNMNSILAWEQDDSI